MKQPAHTKNAAAKVENQMHNNATVKAPAMAKTIQAPVAAVPGAAPANSTKAEAGATAAGTVTAKAKASDDDMFAEMKEMNSFGTDEDKALSG